MKNLVLICLSILSIAASHAQMTISSGVLTPTQYVANLVGSGITFSNVTYTGAPIQIGTFDGVNSNIGFQTGVVMGAGAVTEIMGTGATQVAGQTGTLGVANEPDLLSVANSVTTNPSAGQITTIYDLAALEFDFVPVSNLVSFNFVFSSDEYLTWVNTQYNDVFGFFVSGPGIAGPYASPAGFPNGAINLALVPNTNLPITISTIYPGLNPEYYIDNAGGPTHAMNGFTTPIPITFNVICGETYHFRFAVADCGDNYLSTAVFLQDDSFSSPPVDLTVQTANGTDTIPEACVDANVLFIRSACQNNDSLVVNYTVTGTAQDSVDYQIQDSPVILVPGQDTASINIIPIVDNLPEGTESITISISFLDANGVLQTISGTVFLQDIQPVVITESDFTVQCFNDSIPITAVATGGSGSFTYDWLASASDSTSDIVSINQNGSFDYVVVVTDECLGPFNDTVTVVMNQTLAIDTILIQPATCEPTGAVSAFVTGQTGVPQYTWSGPGPNSPNTWNASVWNNLSSGWYYINVVDNVCAANDSAFVDILNPPIAQMSASTTNGCSPLTITFTNTSENADAYVWNFGDGSAPVNTTSTQSQSHTFTTDAVVQLTANQGANCTNSTTINITIEVCGCNDPAAVNYDPNATFNDGSCQYPTPAVIPPNIFTPNGDGSNDTYFLTTQNALSVNLTILNRWGQVMFEESSANPAWNGKVSSGALAPDGVYFYKYTVFGYDDQKLEGHGFFHLVSQ